MQTDKPEVRPSNFKTRMVLSCSARLLESIQKKKLLDFLPRLVVLESQWLKERNQQEFDSFGDGFTNILSKEEFMNHLKFMKMTGVKNEEEDREWFRKKLDVKEKEFR